jgi:reductive dehalogenase
MDAWEKYRQQLTGEVTRFDQRDDIFRRTATDPEFIELKARFRDREGRRKKPGHTQLNYALTDAAWYLEDHFAMGLAGSNHDGLYAWQSRDDSLAELPQEEIEPDTATRLVKEAARFFGAALVGVCEIDPLWLYSYIVNDITGEVQELNLPERFRYAVVMAVEMDYDFIKTSPLGSSSAAAGLGYSKMAFTAGLTGQFIRGLGYEALPMGNDTVLSIPLAIEAGLGELGRNGLLITEKFGPRVRICKIFTDLPLAPDEPVYFGVDQFCRECKKCADHCPSQAIPHGEKTSIARTRSNNAGVNKWMIDPEQCYRFWAANRTDCSNCIRVCPFNQEKGWIHDLGRFFIKRLPAFNPVLLWLHGLLNYGEQCPQGEWEF